MAEDSDFSTDEIPQNLTVAEEFSQEETFEIQSIEDREENKIEEIIEIEEKKDFCKNCHYHFINLDNKFCPKCGQKTDTHRINFHFLIHEIQHSIFHVDGGIFYTLKHLFTRPGHMLRDYLEGKRIHHFKPVMLLIILGTISGLAEYFITPKKKEENTELIKASKSESSAVDVSGLNHFLVNIGNWLSEHIAFSILFLIPAIAFGFFLGFKKYKINYAEWLIIISYLASFVLVMNFFSIFLEAILHINFSFLYFLFTFCYILWAMLQFFYQKRKKTVVFRTIWAEFLVSIFVIIFISIVAIVLLLIGFSLYGNIEELQKAINK